MNTAMLIEPPPPRPAPLPIAVRPRAPEPVNACIRRLAIANHLRPSQLRSYLTQPPHYIGSVRVRRLAAVSGRTVEALLRTFPHLQAAPRQRLPRDHDIQQYADREELFNAIRHAAKSTFNIRKLTKMFGVPSRTIIHALARVDKPRSLPLNNPILEPFRAHIDQLLAAQPEITVTAIWEILVDEHDYEASYATVRDYVSRQRRLARHSPGARLSRQATVIP